MSALRPAVLLVVLASSVASAEPPRGSQLTATVGIGLAWAELPGTEGRSASGPALRLGLAYHVHPRLAIGAHAALASVHHEEWEHRSMFDVDYDYSCSPMELGVTAQLMVHDQIWLAPWIGMHKLYNSEVNDVPEWTQPATLGYGVALGGDIYQRGVHRVALYLSATRSVKHDPETSDRSEAALSFSLGVAYRHR